MVGSVFYPGSPGGGQHYWLFVGSSSGLQPSPIASHGIDLPWTHTVQAIVSGADVSGDGLSDVIVQVARESPLWQETGRVWLFRGDASPSPNFFPSPIYLDTDDTYVWGFGARAVALGDVDHDGYGDLLAWGFLNGAGYRPFVVYGADSFLGGTTRYVELDYTAPAYPDVGIAVSGIGDINADGVDDFAIGNSLFGRVWVHFGSPGGVGPLPSVEMVGWEFGFGESLSPGGDLNGDGVSDLVVPFRDLDSNAFVSVYFGKPAFDGSGPPDLLIEEPSNTTLNHYFGFPSGSVGDVDGNGTSDLGVSDQFYGASHGVAYLYYMDSLGTPGSSGALADLSGAQGIVEFVGDVNGDGRSDYVNYVPGGTLNLKVTWGRVMPFDGFVVADQAITAGVPVAGGDVLAGGDVNGDGFSDVVVVGGGLTHVFGGSNSGVAATATYALGVGAGPEAHVAVGDVNADGFADVVVGFPGEGVGGVVRVFWGSASGPRLVETLVGDAGGSFGTSVCVLGDVNGDQRADLAVGMLTPGAGEPQVGVLLGTADWTFAGAPWTSWPTAFGAVVAPAGDVNGDGLADLLIGDPGFEVVFEDLKGRALVKLGGAGGMPDGGTILGTGNHMHGSSVSTAGDINADGWDDVVVGVRDDADTSGRPIVGYGSPSGIVVQEVLLSYEQQIGNGRQVSGGADFDGDSFPDVLVASLGGAPQGPPWQNVNHVELIEVASGRNARSVAVHQVRVDDGAPVAEGGLAGSAVEFGLAASAIISGRTRAAIEWRVVEVGSPAVANVATGSYVDSGLSGVALFEAVEFPPGAQTANWRARLATRNIYQPNSRWFGLPGLAADVRTGEAGVTGSGEGGRTIGAGPRIVVSPNPFRGTTRIQRGMGQANRGGWLTIYDVAGRLVDRVAVAEDGAAEWTPQGASAGVYFVKDSDGLTGARAVIVK